jgi:hypothetical protein
MNDGGGRMKIDEDCLARDGAEFHSFFEFSSTKLPSTLAFSSTTCSPLIQNLFSCLPSKPLNPSPHFMVFFSLPPLHIQFLPKFTF